MKEEKLQIIEFKSVESTNLWIKEHIYELDFPVTVLAHEQSLGRGRLDRKWVSPKGGLYMSLAFVNKEENVAIIPQILASVVVQLYGSKKLKIKWPNDLFLDGKKVGGILTEVVHKNNSSIVIVGLGLNIGPLGDEIRALKAAGLDLQETPRQVAKKVSQEFFQQWNKRPFSIEEFEQKLLHKKGDEIVVSQGKKTVVGTFLGLNAQGALILDQKGDRIIVNFGDVLYANEKSVD